MTPADSPALILATLLSKAGLGLSLPTDPQVNQNTQWQVCVGPMVPEPINRVTLADTAPKVFGRNQRTRKTEGSDGVMVMVRSTDYGDGWTKAHAIRAALDQVARNTVVVNGTTYTVHSIQLASGPVFVGQEEQGMSSYFSINVTATITGG